MSFKGAYISPRSLTLARNFKVRRFQGQTPRGSYWVLLGEFQACDICFVFMIYELGSVENVGLVTGDCPSTLVHMSKLPKLRSRITFLRQRIFCWMASIGGVYGEKCVKMKAFFSESKFRTVWWDINAGNWYGFWRRYVCEEGRPGKGNKGILNQERFSW